MQVRVVQYGMQVRVVQYGIQSWVVQYVMQYGWPNLEFDGPLNSGLLFLKVSDERSPVTEICGCTVYSVHCTLYTVQTFTLHF